MKNIKIYYTSSFSRRFPFLKNGFFTASLFLKDMNFVHLLQASYFVLH